MPDLDAIKLAAWTPENCPYLAHQLSDCLSRKSTRGMAGGRFVGEGRIPEPRVKWLCGDARVEQVWAARVGVYRQACSGIPIAVRL